MRFAPAIHRNLGGVITLYFAICADSPYLAAMRKRITIELDEIETAMFDLMMHDLFVNCPGASLDPSELVHDIVRTVLEDDYALHQEHIIQCERTVH